MGLGKASRDSSVLQNTAKESRAIQSVRMLHETAEEAAAREAKLALKTAIRSEVDETLSKFYCEPCNKQYKVRRLPLSEFGLVVAVLRT